MSANNGTVPVVVGEWTRTPLRELANGWAWANYTVIPPDGKFPHPIPIAEIHAGCLLRIMDGVAILANRPATPPAVVEELRAIRALLTPPKPPPTPDPAAEKAARERDSRGRAWAAYVKAGGSGDPGERFPPAPVGPGWETTPIAEMGFSARARKALTVREHLTTLGELCEKTADDLMCVANFGTTSLTEVREKLAELGLKLKGDK